jgi:type II secretory pathway pseudopilin PulG
VVVTDGLKTRPESLHPPIWLFGLAALKKGSCIVMVKSKSERGFTLLESLVVIGIMMVLVVIAIAGSMGSMQNYQANAALDTVTSQLRVAREISITQRRWVQITFDQVGQTISYQVLPPPGTNVTELPGPVITVPLPPKTAFMLEPGVPDTPMGFGNLAPIYIANVSGGVAGMAFTPTGMFSDSTYNNPISGTIFVGIAGQPNSARAVTILGSTGRIRPYTYIGANKWLE